MSSEKMSSSEKTYIRGGGRRGRREDGENREC